MEITLPDSFLTDVLGVLLRVGGAVLVVIAGRWLARRTRLWLAGIMERTTLTPSMKSLFLSVGYYGVWILTIMAALISLGVRAAVSADDYWNLQNDLREQVKLRFDQAGISIPFPQRTVHLVQAAPAIDEPSSDKP